MAVPKPDYLSRDYAGLKASLLQYAAQYYPEWQPASEGDFGMVLAELFAYTGDVLSYYTDRAQFENYIGTATQRDSVLNLAYLLGYTPNSGSPATGSVDLVVERGQSSVLVPAGTQILTNRIAVIDAPVVFETVQDVTLPAWPSQTGDGVSDVTQDDTAYRVTAAVVEGTTVLYAPVGVSTGQPSQSLALPNTGVYQDTIRVLVEDNTGTTQFTSGVTSITARDWTSIDHLLNADSNDAVFEVSLQDNTTVITFGDDINGAIPNTGLRLFVSYRYGYGSQGNVGEGLVRLINDTVLAGVHVATDTEDVARATAMSGGTDPESTDSIRHNAPRSYRTQNRVVSKGDFVDAALGIEGVGKANVVVGSASSVTLFVAGPDGGEPTQRLKDKVVSIIQDKALAGVTVSASSPSFVPVNIGTVTYAVNVEIFDQYSQSNTEAAVRRSLGAFIGNMAFGEKFSVGNVYDVINSVEGVRHVEVPVMARADASQVGVATIFPRDWEIFTSGDLYINMIGGVA